MASRLRRLARRALERTGLIGPYYRWRERQAVRAAAEDPVDDGRPMPPAELAMLVSGPSRRWFSEKGRQHAETIRGLAARHGADVGAGLDVLDFGCGAGRIARWLAPDVIAAGGTFTGSDLNPKLVAWCAANLPGRYLSNGLKPPLDLPARSRDLVYGYSVLTHLTEAKSRAWLAELARVIRPGGLAVLSFHDEAYAGRWGPPEVAGELAHRPYVVWNNALEGSNYMSAWTTQAHLAALAGHAFEVLEIVPGRTDEPAQALAVLRTKPPA
jgi:SAM-dependent methyltransferase